MSLPPSSNATVSGEGSKIALPSGFTDMTHSSIAELSEAFRMLLYCSGNNSVTAPALASTVANLTHANDTANLSLTSPKASERINATTSGEGAAVLVNTLNSEQLGHILHLVHGRSLGAATGTPHIATPGATARFLRSSFSTSSEANLGPFLSVFEETFGGKLTFPDLLMLMNRGMEPREIEEMRSAFRHFDPQNSGTISAAQFAKMFATMGERSNPEEVEELMQLADPEDTGKIDYNAFLNSLLAALK